MQNLQVMIDQLTKERHLHISILDLTGILNNTMTEISFKNVIHSKRFCDIAKSTDKGYSYIVSTNSPQSVFSYKIEIKE